MSDPSQIIVGLDIGTTKVVAVVASVDGNNKVDILGVGSAPCDGLRKGVVTNITKTSEAIRIAVDQASKKSGYQIGRVIVGVSGEHISTSTTRGVVTTSTSEITINDLQRLHQELRQVSIPPDRRILHVIPQEYLVDGQDEIEDPLGMSGKRLEANALVITASDTAFENLKKSVERADLRVDAFVLQPLASALAVLADDEQELGVALMDIGGGTTDVAVFKNKVLRFAAIVGFAGQKVTDDITTVLSIRSTEAERIKKDYGRALAEEIKRDVIFQVPGVGGRSPTELTSSMLCQIIEPRMEEILEIALQQLMESGMGRMVQSGVGVVITGGGAQLMGTDALAQRVYKMPVSIGYPRGFTGDGLAAEVKSPAFATAVGLVLYAVRHGNEFGSREIESALVPTQQAHAAAGETNNKEAASDLPTELSTESKKGIVQKVKDWLENL